MQQFSVLLLIQNDVVLYSFFFAETSLKYLLMIISVHFILSPKSRVLVGKIDYVSPLIKNKTNPNVYCGSFTLHLHWEAQTLKYPLDIKPSILKMKHGKKKKFTYIDSFFVHGSFLRLLDVPCSFYSKCVCLLIIIINEVFVLLCYVEALTKPGVPWCWMVGQTQVTVHALEDSQMNWKVWSYKVQRASCKPPRHLDVYNFQ